MKITTWNVNGYRAVRSKGLVDWVTNHQPDVLCLQETKVFPDQLPDDARMIPGYQDIWHPAARPGYSGVATFVKEAPTTYQIGLGIPQFDSEGRLVMTRYPGFILMNVYFPNGQRDHDRLSYKLDFYARLLDWCDQLHAAGENIVIGGDFNTAHREIDLANPRQNATTSGFLPEERVWIDYYLDHGFVDSYRWLYPDRVEYTWWTYRFGARDRNIGWRIDYFLMSRTMIDHLVDVTVHRQVLGSDHCPVTIEIQN